MKLRNKVLIGIGVAWLVFMAITYASSKMLLMRSFIKLEQQHTDQDLGRVDQALDQLDYSLYTFSSDWSHWDDLYAFMQGKEPQFIPGNINMTAFLNSTINVLTYWNKEGKLIMGLAVDTNGSGAFVAYPTDLDKYLYPNSLLLSRTNPNKDMRGYILLPQGVMMTAAVAITNGDKTQPPIGATVTGRFISDKIVQKIENQTKLQLKLFTPSLFSPNSPLDKIFQTISNNKTGHYSENINTDTLQGYTVIRDIYGKPIAMFQETAPRAIYQTGREAINYFLISFVVLGIIFSLLMMGMLRLLIIRRLEKLNKDVAEIGSRNELSRRVDDTGHDELSTVSSEINRMLGVIEASQSKLEQRVEQRTEELKKTNVKLEQEIQERRTVEKELVIHKEHLVRLAHYDGLTSLPNRVYFNEMLNKAISRAGRNGSHLAILFVDLDRFKAINDAFGHSIGDKVLKEIASRFSAALRPDDILARLGGDEFIILLQDISEARQIENIAKKMIAACEKPTKVDSHEFYFTASIGICVYPEHGKTLEDLQRNADIAMYQAKRSGGGVCQFFTQAMNEAADEHAKLEAALRLAIKNNEFVLNYQPKLDVKEGIVKGVEALIRWESPTLGMVSPAKFIPLAEETGLILQIGEWTLWEACRANKAWQAAGYTPITVAVNLSPKQFRHQDIAEKVKTILAETGLEPRYLELEITETAVMDDVQEGINKLKDIRDMGVSIAMDDFGTGYTSISYLKRFPVSILKIDQSFIKGIPSSKDDEAITMGIIALAHSLKMKVVAEGVETAEQMQFLADHDCDIVQGYYLSRPLPDAKVREQFVKLEKTTTATA